MGNSVSSVMAGCLVPITAHHSRQHSSVFAAEPLDEGLGHTFCYIRPSPESPLHTSPSYTEPSNSSFPVDAAAIDYASNQQTNGMPKTYPETTFKAISGASVSANTSTPCTIACPDQLSFFAKVPDDRAAAFESTSSFTALPLQPIPKDLHPAAFSGPIPSSFERGLISGPLERGFMSGPLERSSVSGPIELSFERSHFSAPLPASYTNYVPKRRRRKTVAQLIGSVSKPMKRVLYRAMPKKFVFRDSCENSSFGPPSMHYDDGQSLQWAQGKAGEDRVHVVLSDRHGWLFVGIYDGFNGPDAPDFLMRNLYPAIYKELQGLLWDQPESCTVGKPNVIVENSMQTLTNGQPNEAYKGSSRRSDCCFFNSKKEDVKFPEQILPINKQRNQQGLVGAPLHLVNGHCELSPPREETREGMPSTKEEVATTLQRSQCQDAHHKRSKETETTVRCRYDWDTKESSSVECTQCRESMHDLILEALSRALEATEEAYLDMANQALEENPELALMGSCILVMLMKDEDVYVLNVGDSRAIVAQHRVHKEDPLALHCSKADRDSLLRLDLERIIEEMPTEVDGFNGSYFNASNTASTLSAVQLSADHSTSIDEEIRRIKAEHPDDRCSIVNDRVKGTLKVTRAFGAGFLKKPQWNNAILEAFRIDYVGTAPYISCTPALHHHRLSPDDRFLILSSDGLYQYLSNQEAVHEVECFMERFPEGDPAQHLIEELLFRAAKKAGMNFHELLDIPQGDRRKYHDDVSLMVISLEGRIWRSCS